MLSPLSPELSVVEAEPSVVCGGGVGGELTVAVEVADVDVAETGEEVLAVESVDVAFVTETVVDAELDAETDTGSEDVETGATGGAGAIGGVVADGISIIVGVVEAADAHVPRVFANSPSTKRTQYVYPVA